MIYSTELANQIQESKNKYLEAGIHENVKLLVLELISPLMETSLLNLNSRKVTRL